MSNIKNFLESLENENTKTLAKRVFKKLETEENFLNIYEDVLNYGMSVGVLNFVHYTETVKFYQTNKRFIMAEVEDLASSLGVSVIDFIIDINNLSIVREQDVIDFLENGRKSESYEQIANSLTWFGCEEICRKYYDFVNNQ